MSAWMFDHGGMDRVVDAIVYAAKHGCPTPMTLLMPGTQVGNRLFKMNSEALYARYGNDPSYCDPPPDYAYKASRADEIQMCKTLHCFTYQCSEGDVPDSTLYQQITAIEQWFDARVGYGPNGWTDKDNERAYDRATWG